MVLSRTINEIELIESLLQKVGLHARFRSPEKLAWNVVASELQYLPVAYSQHVIDFQLAYYAGAGNSLVDISLVIFHDNTPCAIWPLSIQLGTREPISSFFDQIMPPLFISGFSKKSQKSILKLCHRFLVDGVRACEGTTWRIGESFHNEVGLSEWYQQAVERCEHTRIEHELFVDLSLSIEDIKASIRKSYKPLISAGVKYWDVELMDDRNDVIWQEFRNLHLQVSGRVTRSDETWKSQHLSIETGNEMLIYLRNSDNRMVGGALFNLTKDEGSYSVGVYDRSLFNKPLGHVVQFKAIEEMKNRGLLWYSIGKRFYHTDTPNSTKKEISISEFKHGFATHMFPKYCLICETKKE